MVYLNETQIECLIAIAKGGPDCCPGTKAGAIPPVLRALTLKNLVFKRVSTTGWYLTGDDLAWLRANGYIAEAEGYEKYLWNGENDVACSR